jgi:hypothetical protein
LEPSLDPRRDAIDRPLRNTAIFQGLECATLSRGELLVSALASEHRQIIGAVTSALLGQKLAEAAAFGRNVQFKLKEVRTVGREAKSTCLVRIPLTVAALTS